MGIRFLTPDVAILTAVAEMIPPGRLEINLATNAQCDPKPVITKRGEQWRIALFQNTPALFHGRPELAQQLTEELRELL
jgi:uncharacterized protein (TIGR02246 family)